MIVTTVEVHVREDHIQDFIDASVKNHRASVREPGNLRFDVLQSMEDPTRFTLYEAYKSEADAVAHKETDHYKEWRATVADWMARPRQGTPHRVIVPGEVEEW